MNSLFDAEGNLVLNAEKAAMAKRWDENKARIEKDLERVALYLDIEVELEWRDDMATARCEIYGNGLSETIVIGTDNGWLYNLRVVHKVLVHEALHAAGKRHDSRARAEGYYSNIARDTYSSNTMRELGWEVPTKDEIRKPKPRITHRLA